MQLLTFFQEGIFKTNHLIYLFLSLIIILLYLFVNRKYSISIEKNITFLLVICIINELVKIYVNMIDTNIVTGLEAGGYYNPRYLPFQLCSFQMFLFLALKCFVKNAETKQKILCFMMPCLMIGASISLFIPTDGTSLTDIQVYRYYIYHAFLIAFGIYLVVFKKVKITFKVYLRNLLYLASYALICIWINSFLSYANVNFMFLRRPPIEGLPILNLNHGYFIYLITILSLGVIILTLVHVPFLIYNQIKNREML